MQLTLLFARRQFDQQPRRLDLKGISDLLQDEHRWVPDAALDTADVGAMQFALERKLLLREASCFPVFLQI